MERALRFHDLVTHFFGRFFDKESLSPDGEPEAGVIQTLGILAVPSAFIAILVMPLSFRGWDLAGFRYIFVSYSMIVMGFVMVFEWDALFPDRRDYQILVPMPLRLSTLFLAKAAALTVFLAMFLLDINLFGVLFWPGVEGGKASFLTIIGAHLVAVLAGGLFMALAIAALQGVLVTLFHGALYRRVSVCVQTGLMALLVMLLFLTPLLGMSMRGLAHANHPFFRYFPPFWFAGLYEQMRPAVRNPLLQHLGVFAVRGIWCSAAIFLLTFLPGYRRHARRVLEAPEPSPNGPGFIRRALHGWLNRRLLKDPVECGVFHYIGETIMRSPKHRLFLATYGGFGAALAVMTVVTGGGRSLDLPLTLSFILVSGLRAAFNFPAELRANWAFQLSETRAAAPYLRATRKWVIAFGIVPLFLLLLPLELRSFSLAEAVFHFEYGVLTSVVLMEVMFVGFRKVPFTCARLPGKVNLTFLSVIYIFGFTMYSRMMAGLERLVMTLPAAPVLLGAAILILLVWVKPGRSKQTVLDFEDPGEPVVRTLGLAAE